MRRVIGRGAAAATVSLACVAIVGVAARWSGTLDHVNMIAPLTLIGLTLAGVAALVLGGTSRIAVMLALLVGFGGVLDRLLPEWRRSIASGAEPARRDDLRVLTWNVWFDNTDPAAAVAGIRASGADVVLLQETTGTIHPALSGLAAIYPHRSFCSDRCGLVILSRRPLTGDRYRFRDAANRPFGPGLQWARTTAPDGGPASVVTLHYHHLGQHRDRLALALALRRVPVRDMILTGDMNLTPWAVAMQRQDAVLAPLVRVTRALATWPVLLLGKSWPVPVLPIDQIYAGPEWRAVSVDRLVLPGSDHAAVMATLRRVRGIETDTASGTN